MFSTMKSFDHCIFIVKNAISVENVDCYLFTDIKAILHCIFIVEKLHFGGEYGLLSSQQ